MVLLSEQKTKGPPLFLVHGAGASGLAFQGLAKRLETPSAVYAFDDEALTGSRAFDLPSIKAAAEMCVKQIQGAIPVGGHCMLGGWSYGGVVALDIAQQLEASGYHVDLVALLDAPVAGTEHAPSEEELALVAGSLVTSGNEADAAASARLASRTREHFIACTKLLCAHRSSVELYAPVVSFRPQPGSHSGTDSVDDIISKEAVLHKHSCTKWSLEFCDGDHWTLLLEPSVDSLARKLEVYITGANQSKGDRLEKATVSTSLGDSTPRSDLS